MELTLLMYVHVSSPTRLQGPKNHLRSVCVQFNNVQKTDMYSNMSETPIFVTHRKHTALWVIIIFERY